MRPKNSEVSFFFKQIFLKFKLKILKTSDSNNEIFEKNRLVVFTNDFFTVYQDPNTSEMNISLNEIVQTLEEQKRTEALGEKLFLLLKDRPRHRALLTNECKLNHSLATGQYILETGTPTSPTSTSQALNSVSLLTPPGSTQTSISSSQEDETFYTRELIHIYGQPIVPSFHKHFNYQLSNTHYGYRTLRRLLNCDILKKFVKITKEEIKSLDRVVEFVQLTSEKCLSAFQLNLTSFYDPKRFENGIVKNWLDVWYVDRLKEKYSLNECKELYNTSGSTTSPNPASNTQSSYSILSGLNPNNNSWSMNPQPFPAATTSFFGSKTNNCFLQTFNCLDETSAYSSLPASSTSYFKNQHHLSDGEKESECDQANHLWFCLRDYSCSKMEQFLGKLADYVHIRNNKSELILVHTAHPLFEYKDVLSEARKILAIYLNKSTINKTIDELINPKFPVVAREHIENLLNKFLNVI